MVAHQGIMTAMAAAATATAGSAAQNRDPVSPPKIVLRCVTSTTPIDIGMSMTNSPLVRAAIPLVDPAASAHRHLRVSSQVAMDQMHRISQSEASVSG